MSATGLFLSLFLVVHLSGNFQLLLNDNGESFNKYADFMGHNPLIQAVSIGNFFFIILHFVMATVLTLKNKKSRSVQYAKTNKSSSWTSRNMYLFGAVILVFIVIHLSNFWFVGKFGSVCNENISQLSVECQNEFKKLGITNFLNSDNATCKTEFANLKSQLTNSTSNYSICKIDYGSGPVKDLYSVVHQKFSNLFYVIFYVGCMLFIAFHLWHGLQSAFQTIGASHYKYTPIIKAVGYFFAILVSLGFAIIPLIIFLKG